MTYEQVEFDTDDGHEHRAVPASPDTGSRRRHDYSRGQSPACMSTWPRHPGDPGGGPDCFIIDGIQHAAHGQVDIDDYGVDGNVVSGYKFFPSQLRRGVGVDRGQCTARPARRRRLECLGVGRGASAYAAFSAVVRYLEW